MSPTERWTIARAGRRPELRGLWDGPAWGGVSALPVARFRPESTAHRPRTECKLLYDDAHLYAHFRVEDHYVRSVGTRFQDPVHLDSCVELFVRPKSNGGYFNFEVNCGGAQAVSYILDPRRVPGGFVSAVPLGAEAEHAVERFHSMPAVVEPERVGATTWFVEMAIPVALLEAYAGPIGSVAGTAWRANVYKCGDATSHPHWASWAPVPELNFHAPESFGTFLFAASSTAEAR